MQIQTHRRGFLRKSLAGATAIGLTGSVPPLLVGASRAASLRQTERVLVVIQLSGGNDGLNTVIPYADDDYYRNRFTLAIPQANVLKIDQEQGFHPALRGFSSLLENRQLTVVQSVGYPQPNRSHFESMDLWHTAHQMKVHQPEGWLGRSINREWPTDSLPAMHLGRGVQPLALASRERPVPSIRSIDNFRLEGLRDTAQRQQLQRLLKAERKNHSPLLAFLQDSAEVAIETSQQMESVKASTSREFGFPGTELGRNLSTIAQLIESGLETRVYYVTLDGFDTHSSQGETHQNLLRDLGDSVAALMKQLQASGQAERVAVLAFSEFGRRVRENASQGTDHGAAAPLFVVREGASQGVLGAAPDLNDLDQGDLKFQLDYRSVYRDLLEDWLEVDAHGILGGEFESAGLFV